jgi:glycosyltransferase involved in cell wall biosynthesis
MWMHKQHDLIIKAFSASCAHATDVEHILVFTGSQSDYRNTGYSEYIQRLIDESQVSKRIIRLGEIDRQDQLDLISASQCLIQASRFEGGPGASGVLEAALLSVPIIASDIPCNLELNIGKCSYFRSGSIDDLSALLVQMMTRRRDIAEAKERTSRISLSRDIVSLSSGLQLLWEFDHILANSDLQVKDDPYVR